MFSSRSSALLGAAGVLALTSTLSAQWVTFQNQTASRLVSAPGLGATDPQEKDYAHADFDRDGDIDLVVVRKEPFTTTGRYPNVLFMNENGVLTDRTAALASTATVAGSQGFLDATNDRDVVAVDVNGDTWLDVVTATTLSAGLAQYLRVPRVYLNRGNDAQGVWLGFLFDDPLRIDDMALGWQGVHRFCSVSAGDVDNDGDQDLYFGDYEQGGARALDINDRLLLNDGTGYFSDQSGARMTATMLESSFAMSTAIVDMNLDGKLDILKDDALNAPQGVSISYNNGAGGPGWFGTYVVAHSFAPYHLAVGDLNNDGLPDMVVSDDGADRYALHNGVVGGLATFQPAQTFSFTGGGSDDGFSGNNRIADLNNDGWNDVVICDVDVDIAGYNRRCHIYRNLGNAPNVTLQEELVGGAVCGIPTAMLTATFEVGIFDVNGDGWKDIVIGRATGTEVWINVPPIGVSFAYPSGLVPLIAPGQLVTLDIVATGIGGVVPAAGTGLLHWSLNGAAWATLPLRDEGPGRYSVKLPRLHACADQLRYYVSVQGTASGTYTDPPLAPVSFHSAVGATGTATVFEDNMEGSTAGWTVVNHASLTSGAWVAAAPIGTTNLGQFANPPEDAESSTQNTRCFVTQNGAVGGAAGAADVDGGPTDLISPPVDLAGTDAFITYSRWFYASDSVDSLIVSVSGNGTTWVAVDTVTGGGHNQWNVRSFRVSDFITPTNAVRVRFRTADVTPASITEAGVDLFRIEAFLCECTPICQLDIGLSGPGSASFRGSFDLPNNSGPTIDFLVEGAPPGTAGWILGSFDLLPVAAFGGTIIAPAPFLVLPFVADAQGTYGIRGLPGGLGPFVLFGQGVYLDAATPFGVGITNALRIEFP